MPNAPALTQQVVAELLGQLLRAQVARRRHGALDAQPGPDCLSRPPASVEMLYEFEAPLCAAAPLCANAWAGAHAQQPLEHTLAWYRREQNINA